jgi:hypothetical protein
MFSETIDFAPFLLLYLDILCFCKFWQWCVVL